METNKKKLMVLGSSYSQVPLIKAAKELGYKTVVATLPGDNPGIKEADEVFYGDLRNPDEILAGAQQNKIDGIATCCMDTGIKSLGYVCDKMQLKGISEKAGIISSNKADMKDIFEKSGVSTAKFRKVSSKEELENVINDLQLPLIVKAVDLQGSLGIYIARTKDEVRHSYEKTMSLTKEHFCIVEEFIEGNEFGAQAFIYEGEIIYVLLHNDMTYSSSTAIPVGHSMPFEGDKSIEKIAIEQSKLAIKAIGLDNCAVNIDLIEKDGKVYIIELTGRIGATCLPELVSIYYGIDIYKMIVLMAMGENPKSVFENRNAETTPCLAQLLISEKSGTVKDLINKNKIDDNIVDISFNINKGSEVEKFTNGSNRIGQVILKGTTLNECKSLLKSVEENITVVFE
ncbi:ATP-grasp domain-containing protein [Niallia endozanthoxylica]|uniref:ATP-grasp domain-containing protein n=1 Tax=Niallia endozanthoxylica TaxID=2036016 RepID=A0A5J5GZX3_9BACI|nr:ATP-grasp domain-containing protein [Niallia endozanthoxylica]KAA9013825.1 ATP-grasp domain-containing protein [Niallia endozanthoxylica]